MGLIPSGIIWGYFWYDVLVARPGLSVIGSDMTTLRGVVGGYSGVGLVLGDGPVC